MDRTEKGHVGERAESAREIVAHGEVDPFQGTLDEGLLEAR